MVLALTLLFFILQAYFYLMITFILLSWFPSVHESKIFYYLYVITNPYLRIFRGVLVFGTLDFTPIVGFMIYSYGLNAFGQLVASL
jgi:YggT family protein